MPSYRYTGRYAVTPLHRYTGRGARALTVGRHFASVRSLHRYTVSSVTPFHTMTLLRCPRVQILASGQTLQVYLVGFADHGKMVHEFRRFRLAAMTGELNPSCAVA